MTDSRRLCSRERKTTSVEGRYCIFSEHPVPRHPPEMNLNTGQVAF